jgi:16S rRNA processing protein RimM
MGEQILVGRVNGLFGVRGWLRVFSYSRPPAQLLNYNPVLLKNEAGIWQSFEVEDKQAFADGKLVLKLKGIDEREAARALMGQDISIMPTQLVRSDDDVYWVDLIGCELANQQGQVIGNIIDMMETGANDVMRVKRTNGEVELVPFVMEVVVKRVDLSAKQVVVDWESGYF